MTGAKSSCTGADGVGDHAGQPIDSDKQFSWAPPTEIGSILSADTNIKSGSQPSFIKPWLIMLGLSLIGYLALGEVMPRVIEGKGDPQIVRYIGIGVGLLLGLLSLLYTWPATPECTYVGSDGAALLRGKWGQPEASKKQAVVFRDMNVLFASSTHMYKNLIYDKTLFHFHWHKEPGGPADLAIFGEHKCKDAPPPAGNIFYFGMHAEDRWMEELLGRHGSTPPTGQTLTFPCRNSDIKEVRLQSDRIEFVYKQHVDAIPFADLGRFDAKRGVLQFDQNDATWFSNKGKFRLKYGNLGNAGLFLHYLAQLLQQEQ